MAPVSSEERHATITNWPPGSEIAERELHAIRDLADGVRLKQLLSVVPEAIVLVGRGGEVFHVNDQAVELFGRPESELLGELSAFSVEEGHVSEVEILHPKGTRLAELRVSSIEWFGEPAHVASLRDVTAIRAKEADYRRAQKMEALGRVAGGVAHDFNNLLFAIMTYAEIVRDTFESGDERRHDMEQILTTATRSRELIAKLLAFARGRPSSPSVVDVAGATRSLCANLAPTLPATITFRVDIAPDLWPVCIDPVELDQVLVNMIVNARDAVEGDGRVSITAVNAPAGPLHNHDMVRLLIADNGHGIDPAIAEKIYEPFFTTKALNLGTGLGLAACHGIVREAGGEIRFESTVGAGTTFEILLPRAPMALAHPPASPVAAAEGERKPSILVIDDDAAVRMVVSRALRERGFAITEVNGASAADRAFAAGLPFDVVISDIRMPGEDGISLARRIRTLRPQLPVVLMSGYAPDVTQIGLDDIGVGPILGKPFGIDELLARIESELTRSASLGRRAGLLSRP